MVKKISLGGLNEREQADALNEVKVMASLGDHPHVVKYYDSFIDASNYLNIVMEYAPRGNLHDFIREYRQRHESLPDPLVWRFFLQCAVGLQYMHSKHILHRDVKTPNVFLDGNCNVKLGDLGVAKVLSSHTHFAVTLVGTPYYLSPELCSNKQYNAKSDVWALGCVLYECCTQRHPFDANNQGALVLKILRGKYPMRGLAKRDPELIAVMKRCLTHEAKRRPDSTSLLRAKLVRTKADEIGVQLPASIMSISSAESSRSTVNGRPRSARGHGPPQQPQPVGAVPGRPLPPRAGAAKKSALPVSSRQRNPSFGHQLPSSSPQRSAMLVQQPPQQPRRGDDELAVAALPDVVVPERRSAAALRHVAVADRESDTRTEYVRASHISGSSSAALPSTSAAGTAAAAAAMSTTTTHASSSSGVQGGAAGSVYVVRPPSARSRRVNTHNEGVDIAFRFGNVAVDDKCLQQQKAGDAKMAAAPPSSSIQEPVAAYDDESGIRVNVGVVGRGSGGWPQQYVVAASGIDANDMGDDDDNAGMFEVDEEVEEIRVDESCLIEEEEEEEDDDEEEEDDDDDGCAAVAMNQAEMRRGGGGGGSSDNGGRPTTHDGAEPMADHVDTAVAKSLSPSQIDPSGNVAGDRSPSPSKIEKSLIQNIKATKQQCVNLVGESAFEELYNVIKARATGNLADAPSIAALSRIVFSIIGYGQAQAVTMVYHVLAAEEQLLQHQRRS